MVTVLIAVIRAYQKHVSRWTPAVCRFQPTCSEYAIQAFQKYGLLRGCSMTTARILRCHPFRAGGYDPVK